MTTSQPAHSALVVIITSAVFLDDCMSLIEHNIT